ncbi:MAG: hypothetical protein KKC23_00915 [Proteobacteria bacterium]|nr:hypothetical protein [Pseudomonadota bacterium]
MKITKCNLLDMMSVIYNLEKMGIKIKKGKDWVVAKAPKTIKPITIKTCEYPGFPTDLQAPFSVLLTQACGRSFIFETIFEGRLNYLTDIERMGANVVLCDPHRAIINGPTRLRGRETESPDLRAGLAFLIAGLVAQGKSVINNVENIDRGYERVEDRLNTVGAEIRRVE